MAEYNVTRTLVLSAVTRAIREIEEDPKRAMRRITDMGREFSKSRFQILVFDIIQELLSDDDSIYYAVAENLLKTTDEASVKDFGVNLAYMSWTHGARILRRRQKELGVCLPWEITLFYDPEKEDGTSPEEIRKIIEEGTGLGIYSFHINQRSAAASGTEIPALMADFPDCAFSWGLWKNDLTRDHIQALKKCRGAMTLLNGGGEGLYECASMLRSERLLFGVWITYKTREDLESLKNDLIPSISRGTGAPYLILVAQEGADPSVMAEAAAFCRHARMVRPASCFLVDYSGDSRTVSDLICGHSHLLIIGPDRQILYPDPAKGKVLDIRAGLPALMKDIFPPCPADLSPEGMPGM